MICVTLPASTGGSLTNLEKTWKPGAQTLTFLRLDARFGQRLPQRLEHRRFARGLLRPFGPERLEAILLQAQTAGFVDFKLGQLEAARPEINRQK